MRRFAKVCSFLCILAAFSAAPCLAEGFWPGDAGDIYGPDDTSISDDSSGVCEVTCTDPEDPGYERQYSRCEFWICYDEMPSDMRRCKDHEDVKVGSTN